MFDFISYLSFLDKPLSLFHPLALMIYAYSLLCLGGAFGAFYARKELAVKSALLDKELPGIESQLDDLQDQLRDVHYQVNQGLNTLQDLKSILKGFALGLVESKVAGLLLALLATRPGWMKLVAKQGVGLAFKKVK